MIRLFAPQAEPAEYPLEARSKPPHLYEFQPDGKIIPAPQRRNRRMLFQKKSLTALIASENCCIITVPFLFCPIRLARPPVTEERTG